jgi:hypothetical protein
MVTTIVVPQGSPYPGWSKICISVYFRHPWVMTAPGAAPALGGVDAPAEWRELEAAIGDVLWRYAEAVTGLRRDASGEPLEGLPFPVRWMHPARLSAARRARHVLRAAKADAIEHSAT